MSGNNYPYKALSISPPEIRLIELQPSSFSDEIRCSLKHARFPLDLQPYRDNALIPTSPYTSGRLRRLAKARRPESLYSSREDQVVKAIRIQSTKEDVSEENSSLKVYQDISFAGRKTVHSSGAAVAPLGIEKIPEGAAAHPLESSKYNLAEEMADGSSPRHEVLDPLPNYEALSYTWGDADMSETILVDEIEISVRRNLWIALVHLRLADKPRLLWIDAISINQDNIQERNQQVKMMRYIYAKADRVLSFVGVELADPDVGLDFAELLNVNMTRKRLLGFIRHWEYEKYWRAIGDLWSQDYWKRVWVVQEVVVATKVIVYFGRRSIGWSKFAKLSSEMVALSRTGHLPVYISILRNSMPVILWQLRTSSMRGRGWPLVTLLELCRNTLSTDPRDKIYGLLGLQFSTTNSMAERYSIIEADYSKSTRDLWESAVVSRRLRDEFHVISFSQFVQELLGGIPEGQREGLLVKDETSEGFQKRKPQEERDYVSMKDIERRRHRLLPINGYESMRAKAQGLHYTPGVCRSSILFLGPSYTSQNSSLKLIGQWLKLYFHQTKIQNDAEKVPAMLIDSIIKAQSDLHKIVSIESPQSYAELGQYAYVSYREKELGGYSETELSLGDSTAEGSSFEPGNIIFQRSGDAVKGKGKENCSGQPRWFISDCGQIGIAPSTAEEGDRICQFKDCDVVALIQKTGEGNKCRITGRAVIMRRWDREQDALDGRFRYSTPDDAWFSSQFHKDVNHAVDQGRVSLYVDIMTLWALTR